MNLLKYFRCKKCNTLIRYLNWNKEKERHIKEMICPHCSSLNSFITLKKRPYYRLKHQTYLSLWVKRNGEYIVISR